MTRPEKIVRRFIRDHGPVFLNDNEMPDSVREVRVALDELVAERDRLDADLRLANETIRVFETSQIPMVPRAAQKRLDAAEAERDRYKQALEEARLALTRARASVALEMYGGSRSNTAKHIDAARAALDDKDPR